MFEEKLNKDEEALYNIMIGNDPEKLTLSIEDLNAIFNPDDSIIR